MVKARQVDERRRVTLPREFRPGQDVIFERVDAYTWIVKRHRPDPDIKMVLIPVIKRLPDDPEWDKLEIAFARAACKKLPPPEE